MLEKQQCSTSAVTGGSSLLWAARLPDVGCKRSPSYHFEPSSELKEKGMLMPEAAVEPDGEDCVVLVVENHGCEPVEVEEGQM